MSLSLGTIVGQLIFVLAYLVVFLVLVFVAIRLCLSATRLMDLQAEKLRRELRDTESDSSG